MISKRAITVKKVAHRFRKEVGLSAPMALRISRRFNTLASRVDWATPLSDKRPRTYLKAKKKKK